MVPKDRKYENRKPKEEYRLTKPVGLRDRGSEDRRLNNEHSIPMTVTKNKLQGKENNVS